jgi:hypothetical protein
MKDNPKFKKGDILLAPRSNGDFILKILGNKEGLYDFEILYYSKLKSFKRYTWRDKFTKHLIEEVDKHCKKLSKEKLQEIQLSFIN